MKEILEALADRWKALSPKQKKPYEHKARKAREAAYGKE
jgi:hypothetical protein